MSDTDPRRTRQLINALGYEAGSWKALSTALRIAQFGAGADWLDDELLAVELDLRKNHQIDDPADYRETYTGGDVGPVWSLDGLTEEDEPVSCEVQGRTPRLGGGPRGARRAEGGRGDGDTALLTGRPAPIRNRNSKTPPEGGPVGSAGGAAVSLTG